MELALDLLCGISWSTVYVFAVLWGIKNKTWCIPQFSICMNFSWEFCAVLNRMIEGDFNSIPFFIQFSWLILDIGVLLTWLVHDKQSRLWQKTLLFAMCFSVIYFLAFEKSLWLLSVFLVNICMSIEFVYRQIKKPDNWNSIIVAAGKLIGTLAATLLNGLVVWNPLVLWLGGVSFLFDMYYLFVLCSKRICCK